jgi:hypothetical protein
MLTEFFQTVNAYPWTSVAVGLWLLIFGAVLRGKR